jgi:hypothetical protein
MDWALIGLLPSPKSWHPSKSPHAGHALLL